jgi:hypothetical protein
MNPMRLGQAVGLIVVLSTSMARAEDATQTKDQFLGTWECISLGLGERIKHVKHVTPTHFTWVTYDRDNMATLAVAGGTWSLRNGVYRERIEFSSETHKNLRGQEYPFAVQMEGDTWTLRSTQADLTVNEVWKRIKRVAEKEPDQDDRDQGK